MLHLEEKVGLAAEGQKIFRLFGSPKNFPKPKPRSLQIPAKKLLFGEPCFLARPPVFEKSLQKSAEFFLPKVIWGWPDQNLTYGWGQKFALEILTSFMDDPK